MSLSHIREDVLDRIINEINDDRVMATDSYSTINKACRAMAVKLGIVVVPKPAAEAVDNAAQVVKAACDSPSTPILVETNPRPSESYAPDHWTQRVKVNNLVACHRYSTEGMRFSGKNKIWSREHIANLLPQLHAFVEHGIFDDGTQKMAYPRKVVPLRGGDTAVILSTRSAFKDFPIIAMFKDGATTCCSTNGAIAPQSAYSKRYDLMLDSQYEPLTAAEIVAASEAGRRVKKLERMLGHQDPDLFTVTGVQRTKAGEWNVVLQSDNDAYYWYTTAKLLEKFVWFDSSSPDDMTPAGKLVSIAK